MSIKKERKNNEDPSISSKDLRPVSFFGSRNFLNPHQNINNQVSISNNNNSTDELLGVCRKNCILPVLRSKDPIKKISIQTMSFLVQKFSQINNLEEDRFEDRSVWLNKVKRCVIIDCRYPYEYLGGHIRGAINICLKEELLKFYEDQSHQDSSTTVIIFHCEFSKNRGPQAAKAFRVYDRKNNAYPSLKFPEIYILEGGYSKFYPTLSNLCAPSNYVSMFDKSFQAEMEEEDKKYHQSWKKHTKKRTKKRRHKSQSRIYQVQCNDQEFQQDFTKKRKLYLSR